MIRVSKVVELMKNSSIDIMDRIFDWLGASSVVTGLSLYFGGLSLPDWGIIASILVSILVIVEKILMIKRHCRSKKTKEK